VLMSPEKKSDGVNVIENNVFPFITVLVNLALLVAAFPLAGFILYLASIFTPGIHTQMYALDSEASDVPVTS